MSKLGTEASAPFCLELKNRFDALQSCPPDSLDSEWKALKEGVSTIANTHLGYSKRRRQCWISDSTIALTERCQRARIQKAVDYPTIRRETTRALRRDRNDYWKSIAEQSEHAAATGDSRKLFRLINQVSKPFNPVSDVIFDQGGSLVTDVDGKLERWKDHFQSTLNHPLPVVAVDPSDPPIGEEYECNVEPPTLEEVLGIINRLKRHKAPGEDGLPAEFFKQCPDVLGPWLHRIILKVWNTEQIPKDWSEAVLLPVHKKGDRKQCSNYRGISLIDVSAKVFTIALLNRFSQPRDRRVRPNQSGFRPGRGCTDQLFNLRRVLEQRWAYQQPTVACFIDFKSAFDSVDRESLWRTLHMDGMPDKLLRLIKAYYQSTTTRVRVYGQESRHFQVSSGVRQGCVLSPVLFNYAIDWVLNHALSSSPGVQVGRGFFLTDLAYADDVVVLGPSFPEVQSALDNVVQFAGMIGLEINAAKTKCISALVPSTQDLHLLVDGARVEVVESFVYLGSKCIPTGQGYADVERRINSARAAFIRLQRCLWSRREIELNTKCRIFQSIVRNVLMYGCETWPLRVSDERRLEVFDNDCLRRILRVRRADHVPVATLRRQCKVQSISAEILKRRLRWFGHVARRPPDELIKRCMVAESPAQWRRRTGGQFRTWFSTVKKDLALVSGPATHGLRTWRKDWLKISCDLAQDRVAWAAAIHDVVNAREDGPRNP